MPQEDLILTTAVALSKKKYTAEEEELVKELTNPKAKIDVLIPADMDPEKFDVAMSAVSKVYARATLQAQAIFPILGRLLQVADSNPALWEKKAKSFEEYRISLADKFGLGRQTSYDALEYARRWMEILPPDEFKTVGRVKLKSISKVIGKGDEGKKTARALLEFAKEHTQEQLDAHMDDKLHTGKGSTVGAKLKINCNKRQLKDFEKWFKDPRVVAYCESDNPAEILDKMIAECETEWYSNGTQMIEAAAEAAQQAEKEGEAVTA